MAQESVEQLDALVIGAGVSGLYALHHLRRMGLSVLVCDGAGGIGGTWWYNGYPGARVDGPGSPFYCYTFADELMQEWDWAETQPSQAEVLAYLEHVADRFDLRRHIRLNTWIRNPDTTRRHSVGRLTPAPEGESPPSSSSVRLAPCPPPTGRTFPALTILPASATTPAIGPTSRFASRASGWA